MSFTFRYLYEIPAALEHSASVDEYAVNLAWAPAGREEEAIRGLRDREKANPPGRLRHGVLVALRNYLEGERGKSLEAIEGCLRLPFRDPEARFGLGVLLAKLNEPQRALETISRTLEEGYFCHQILQHHPWLGSLRAHPEFPKLAGRAAERSVQAQRVFLDNGGDRLLRVQSDHKPANGV